MRHLKYVVLAALFSPLIASVAFSDEGESLSKTYSQNYRFALAYTSAENQQVSIEFVVSAEDFHVSTFEPRLEFSGTILKADGRTLVLHYNLRFLKKVVSGSFTNAEDSSPFQTVEVQEGGLSSNIRLKLGTPVDILTVDSESVRLRVTKAD